MENLSLPAISLWQPWGSLVVWGEKHYETRSWSTSRTGWMAIHATKRFPEEAESVCFDSPYRETLHKHGIDLPRRLPVGAVLGFAHLAGTTRITGEAIRSWHLAAHGAQHERSFGDWSTGRIVWRFDKVAVLPTPIPASGGRGIWAWEVPERERERVRELLRGA